MNKIKISAKMCRAIDYSCWAMSMAFAFWADWRIGVAFVAYDLMRAFEQLRHGVKD